jgi:methylated-DNA-[protein]-cysteine S-methyltransferase
MIYVHEITTRLGPMTIAVNDDGALVLLEFGDVTARRTRLATLGAFEASPTRCAHVVAQLEAYFRGELREFELDVAPAGSTFQRRVWDELRRIPYGTTISYAALAAEVGAGAGASRAVGGANAANPVAVVIPCHRVIAANGSISGYAGGVHIKRALLRLEGAAAVRDADAQGSLLGGLQL